MTDRVDMDRRRFLTGRHAVHISSAVVVAWPDQAAALAERLRALPGTEVAHVENGKIVIVMEAPSSGDLGGRLALIADLPGVLAANMVFEQRLDEGDAA